MANPMQWLGSFVRKPIDMDRVLADLELQKSKNPFWRTAMSTKLKAELGIDKETGYLPFKGQIICARSVADTLLSRSMDAQLYCTTLDKLGTRWEEYVLVYDDPERVYGYIPEECEKLKRLGAVNL